MMNPISNSPTLSARNFQPASPKPEQTATHPSETYRASAVSGAPVEETLKVFPLVNGSYGLRFIASAPGQPVPNVLDLIGQWAVQNNIPGGFFTAVGELQDPSLASWDGEAKKFVITRFPGIYEVSAFEGDLAYAKGDPSKGEPAEVPSFHVHTFIAGKDKSAFGGHLVGAAAVPAVMEMMFTPSVEKLHRAVSAGTGGPALEP